MRVNRIHAKADESPNTPLIITGAVYSAADAVTASDLKKTAYSFLSSGKYMKSQICSDGQPTGSKVVASHFHESGPQYPDNSWVLTVAIYDPAIKEMVQKGEINRFSFETPWTDWTPDSKLELFKDEKCSASAKEDRSMLSKTDQLLAKLKAELPWVMVDCDPANLPPATVAKSGAVGNTETGPDFKAMNDIITNLQGMILDMANARAAGKTPLVDLFTGEPLVVDPKTGMQVHAEKATEPKRVVKGFWGGPDMIIPVAKSEDSRVEVAKSAGCGRIWP